MDGPWQLAMTVPVPPAARNKAKASKSPHAAPAPAAPTLLQRLRPGSPDSAAAQAGLHAAEDEASTLARRYRLPDSLVAAFREQPPVEAQRRSWANRPAGSGERKSATLHTGDGTALQVRRLPAVQAHDPAGVLLGCASCTAEIELCCAAQA
jgi:hypothetical protein